MKISTRGRYALRVIIDLAEHQSDKYIPLKDIVARQSISQKYLESITTDLSKAGLLDGHHGKNGGYRLTKAPEDITVKDILVVTEGDLAPVACLEKNAKACELSGECRTLPMWKKFYSLINDFFEGITIKDLMKTDNTGNDYII